jgi:hypothetical protein
MGLLFSIQRRWEGIVVPASEVLPPKPQRSLDEAVLRRNPGLWQYG